MELNKSKTLTAVFSKCNFWLQSDIRIQIFLKLLKILRWNLACVITRPLSMQSTRMNIILSSVCDLGHEKYIFSCAIYYPSFKMKFEISWRDFCMILVHCKYQMSTKYIWENQTYNSHQFPEIASPIYPKSHHSPY